MQLLKCQYSYFCTSKASKLSTSLSRSSSGVSICTFVRAKQVNLVPGGRQTLGRGAARQTRRSPRCSSMPLLPGVSAQFTQFTCCIGAFLVPQYKHTSASTVVRSMQLLQGVSLLALLVLYWCFTGSRGTHIPPPAHWLAWPHMRGKLLGQSRRPPRSCWLQP